MSRHEDELEQKISDKYIENMDAPDLWGRIESGLDVVDAQRAQDKKQANRCETYEDRKTVEIKNADVKVTDIRAGREDGDKKLCNIVKNRRILQIISGLVAAAVVCVLIIAGPLKNIRRSASDKSVQENSASESFDVQSDQEYQNDVSGDDYSISESETNGKEVSDKPVVVSSDSQEDYAPMIMVDGVLYEDTYDMIDVDSVDGSKVFYARSYTDGVPSNDGEVNFDRDPSKNSAYIVCDDGSLIVKVEGNWYRFERAEE